jgi:hypothetical protein
MANISNAFGEMFLKGNWTPEMIDNLNIISCVWKDWHYGIHVEPFTIGKLTQGFSADGRWSFKNNLEGLASWVVDENKPEVTKAFYDLIAQVRKSKDIGKTSIVFNYTEDEPGYRFLQKVEAELRVAPFSLKSLVSYASETYICTGDAKIAFDFSNVDNPDTHLKLTKDKSQYQLVNAVGKGVSSGIRPSFLTALEVSFRTRKNEFPEIAIQEKDGKWFIQAGFAEIVLDEPVSDAGELFEPENNFRCRLKAKVSGIYFPTHTLNHIEIDCTDYDYNVKNMLKLDVYSDIDDVIESYACTIQCADDFDGDSIENMEKFWGEHLGAFLRDVISENDISVDELITKGFFPDKVAADKLLASGTALIKQEG